MIPDDQDITVVEHMTQLNESQREVQRPTAINAHKLQTIIGCWNVRTMYEIGKSAQVAREIKLNEELSNRSTRYQRDKMDWIRKDQIEYWRVSNFLRQR